MGLFDTDEIHRAPQATQTGWARTLCAILQQNEIPGAVMRGDLCCGDRLIVTTRNSVYSMWVLGEGKFAVSGGWFDKTAASPATVTINGCTYGGSVIRHNVIAARGLFLEFGNNVSTTRICNVRVERMEEAADRGVPTLLN
jgi:hypothetical protein